MTSVRETSPFAFLILYIRAMVMYCSLLLLLLASSYQLRGADVVYRPR